MKRTDRTDAGAYLYMPSQCSITREIRITDVDRNLGNKAAGFITNQHGDNSVGEVGKFLAMMFSIETNLLLFFFYMR